MTITNQERVGNGHDFLKKGLAPLGDREFKNLQDRKLAPRRCATWATTAW